MTHPFYPSHLLVFILAFVPGPGLHIQCMGQQTPEPIKFIHQPHEGVNDEPACKYSSDGCVVLRTIGTNFQKNVRLFNAASQVPLGPIIELKAHRITALAISPDHCIIAAAIGNFSEDWGGVRVWNGYTGKEIARYKASPKDQLPPLGEVFQISFSKDGKTLTILSGPAGGP